MAHTLATRRATFVQAAELPPEAPPGTPAQLAASAKAERERRDQRIGDDAIRLG